MRIDEIKKKKPGSSNKEAINLKVVLTKEQEKLSKKLAKIDNEQHQLKLSYPKSLIKNKAMAAKVAEIEEYLENERLKIEEKSKIIQQELDKLLETNPNPLVQLLKRIEVECSDFLSIAKTSGWIYRGIESRAADAFKGKSREYRRAKDSIERFQEFFDTYLKNNGHTAIRSNSIFTSGDLAQASGYGAVYFIFPINGFSFSWYKNTDDGIMNLDDFDAEYVSATALLALGKARSKELMKDVESYADDVKEEYADKFDEYFKNGIYGLLEWDDVFDPITDEEYLSVLTKKFFTRFKVEKTDLRAAITSEHEILINGEYFAISEDYADEIKEYLANEIS